MPNCIRSIMPWLLLALATLAHAETPPTPLDQFTVALPPMAMLVDPVDVAVNANNEFYVIDAILNGPRVVKYRSDGVPLLQWYHAGHPSTVFEEVWSIAVDEATGEVYVGERERVRVFDAAGVYIRTLLWSPYLGDRVVGIDIGPDSAVYFAVNSISGDGVYRSDSQGGIPVPISVTSFQMPRDVAVDSQGRIYVADDGVQIFDADGIFLGAWDENWPWELVGVEALAIDEQDNVIVSDLSQCTKIARDGTVLSRFAQGQQFSGLAVHGFGTLYAASSQSYPMVEKWGYPPPITTIDDITGDQGRWVRLRWDSCPLDRLDLPGAVTGYGVYRRRDDGAVPLSQLAHSPLGDAAAKSLEGWDAVATVMARADSTYSLVAPTLADSTGSGGIAWSVFIVTAYMGDGTFWDSPPDSGYSVDNLPPPALGAPTVLEIPGQGEFEVSWQASAAPDLGHYAVYRGSAPGFLPASPQDHYATTTATWYVDAAVAPGDTWYYRVGVFDDAETFSGYSASQGAQIVSGAAPPGLPARGLAQNVPNPFNPATEIAFRLDREGVHVRLDIYQVDGSHVRRLVDKVLGSGSHTVRWDGRDGAGRSVPSGSYLYRLRAGDQVETKRMTLLK